MPSNLPQGRDLVKNLIEGSSWPLTKREITDELELSYSHVAKIVNDLVASGELALVDKTERGIDLFGLASVPEVVGKT